MYHPNRAELQNLILAINPRSPFGERDRAWVILALHTGLRVSELVGLNVGHLVNVEGQPRKAFVVPGPLAKGKKGRLIPLNSSARKAVAALVAFNRKRGFSVDQKAPILQNRKHRRLTARAARYALQKYRDQADLDQPVTPHSLRHSFGTSLLAKTNNVRVVQAALGHRRLSTTAVYTHVEPGELVQAFYSLED